MECREGGVAGDDERRKQLRSYSVPVAIVLLGNLVDSDAQKAALTPE
jgi:hypothetical protein